MTLSSSETEAANELFDLGGDRFVSVGTLKSLLPDVETALFFAKVYGFNAGRLGKLLSLFHTNLMDVLNEGGHSMDLQDYIVSVVTPAEKQVVDASTFVQDVQPPDLVLPEVWASLEITISKAIQETADKLGDVLDSLPGKEGKMVFATMAQMNRQRPVIGDYRAQIQHAHKPSNLIIFDDSGSVGSNTVHAIADEAVALGWKADAHFAMVSTTTRYWEPGTYNTKDILSKAEYGGTRYETLEDVLVSRPWHSVITIADYDSSMGAFHRLALLGDKVSIGTVLDISLVPRMSFLSECVGQFANEVKSILISGRPDPRYWGGVY